jgi:hypothetical protein
MSELDIKKIVAYQTVAEMHLLFCYTILDFELFIEFLWLFLPAHC